MRRQAGFSMVELMVAIALGLLLTGAVISVFIGSRTAYQATAGVGEMADSGRFALNLIGESVRSAGNLACNSAMSATSQNVVTGGLTFSNNFGLGVQGFEANGTAPAAAIALPAAPAVGAANNWTPNIDPTIPNAIPANPQNVGKLVQGSDVLIVRSTVPRVAPVYTTLDVVPGAAALTVTPIPIAMGGFAAISDCTKSVIFQLLAPVAPGGTAIGLNAGLPGVGFSAGAVVAPLTTTVYYIGVGSDGDSSLFRLEQTNGGPGFNPPGPEELVPDVENMQVLYGVDTAGTQTASAYVTGDQVGALNVVSIQVALLVASPPATQPTVAATPYNLLGTSVTAPVDNRMRNVFNATINLRDAVN
ncbi:MAG: PilW family protein [Gammaproteobacteria bacterium]|nr:PilW family protein [Gammaproteobacteria bacterium]